MEATNAEQDSNAEENEALPPGIEITTYPPTGNLPPWARLDGDVVPMAGNDASSVTKKSNYPSGTLPLTKALNLLKEKSKKTVTVADVSKSKPNIKKFKIVRINNGKDSNK